MGPLNSTLWEYYGLVDFHLFCGDPSVDKKGDS